MRSKRPEEGTVSIYGDQNDVSGGEPEEGGRKSKPLLYYHIPLIYEPQAPLLIAKRMESAEIMEGTGTETAVGYSSRWINKWK